ncbi:GntR family transcriptional regulator [Bacillus thuringiensis]|uniref:GntR family transcriptional regulator n=1 Tax=Bacillus thuringiensis TaxID=1428 RepID=UPI000BEB5A72|nr:GntR family transcriptional regulator [Bacillus thuringiensis]PDX92925.1 GntR family transcriptional regulator [Bacillus thuringiensis]PEA12937.1 GntR family transcriptional regulator [Bacillus thuringiensis]PES41339.1 GntR family transcriptional regulator [Bacillus thuringiensis]PEV37048.1 GntR family transcriptional regulator [Bacillus thuringiensis]PFC05317.1 GntR family transcriptional regulator [Bacillus thuringiensis]
MNSFEQTNSIVAEVIQKIGNKITLSNYLTTNYHDPTALPHQKMAVLNWMNSFVINVA